MRIICIAEGSHEISSLIFSENTKNKSECLLLQLIGALNMKHSTKLVKLAERNVVAHK